MSEKLVFKTTMFEDDGNFSANRAAQTAQQIHDKWLKENGKTVYMTGNDGENRYITTCQTVHDEYKGILINIEEIKKKCVVCEPDTDANFIVQLGNVFCKNCGSKIKAKWSKE